MLVVGVFLRLTLCRHATSEGLKKRRFGLTCLRFFDTSQSVIVSLSAENGPFLPLARCSVALASAILFGITARPSHEELSAASKPNASAEGLSIERPQT
jgi:hypothetical protein